MAWFVKRPKLGTVGCLKLEEDRRSAKSFEGLGFRGDRGGTLNRGSNAWREGGDAGHWSAGGKNLTTAPARQPSTFLFLFCLHKIGTSQRATGVLRV
jgi:hypothetical protein